MSQTVMFLDPDNLPSMLVLFKKNKFSFPAITVT